MSTSTPICRLTDFAPLAPRFLSPQERAIEWIAAAHARSDFTAHRGNPDFAPERLPRAREQLRKVVTRFGASPAQIATRGHHLEDFEHLDWDRMRVFRLEESPTGLGMSERMAVYSEVVDDAFRALYANEEVAPAHLVHVSCTGYASPSGAQRALTEKGWTWSAVTHAYHMGCYAAVPSIRLGAGLLALERAGQGTAAASAAARVDVVHTELCTLHLNPSLHTPEQLVVQSLFADGIVRYCLRPARAPVAGRHFDLLAVHEEQIPFTSEHMTWIISDWGMRMTLSRDVPEAIARRLPEFLDALARRAGLRGEDLLGEGSGGAGRPIFAVHPGGPRIIDQVAALLSLEEPQIAASRAVLRERGNMSSATLPHIWKAILDDDAVPAGTPVVSLAFGPGLTICGAIAVKGAVE